MYIGVPTEIKNHEYRVGLTPESAAEYSRHGHKVLVQSGAGMGIGKSDDDYRALGAEIVPDAASIFSRAEIVIKVKEPQPEEYTQLHEGQLLFTYLHLAPDLPQTTGLLKSGVTAIAYETVTAAEGGLPLLAPMSEVAGRLSAQALAQSLEKHHNGCGVLLGGVPGVMPANVVIIGGGVVGTQAATICLGMGAQVSIFDTSLPRLRQLDAQFRGAITTRYPTKTALKDAFSQAHGVVGAVLVPGAAAPKILQKQDLAMLQPGAVLVDVAIDQGGCFATSKPTTHAAPTYLVDGIVHYCVANMPGAVPRTSSYALNHATLPFGLALANHGLEGLKENSHLLAGLHTHKGKLLCKPVAEVHGIDYHDPLVALAS